MDKIGAYLRRLQNPLLYRKDFLERKKKPREKVDQFFAALQVIYNSCAYDDHALTPEELRISGINLLWGCRTRRPSRRCLSTRWTR